MDSRLASVPSTQPFGNKQGAGSFDVAGQVLAIRVGQEGDV